MKRELFDYDDSDLSSVLAYSESVVGRTHSEIIDEYIANPYKSYKNFQSGIEFKGNDKKISSKSKGQYGNNIEKYFYGYHPNNDAKADFEKIGVELKVTPFKVNKNGSISAKERLVLTIINYMEENLDDFYATHMWEKCSKILLLFYNGLVPNRALEDYIIEKLYLYEWFEEDMPTILEDYKNITDKIKSGRAHELSESDGNYLSTCTKGAGKGKDDREQPYSDIPAKQRAWELKSSYMTYLIKNKIFNHMEQESIVSNFKGIKKPFTEIISENILKYRGYTEKELYDKFSVNSKSKNKNNLVIKKILGITGDVDKTEEFEKANMNLRVVRVNKKGLPKEDSPFKNYKFKELVENDIWEESFPYLEICQKRFLFVTFKEQDSGEYVLDKVKFWGIPDCQVEEIHRVWLETKEIIKNGILLTQKGNAVSTNFPQSKSNKVLFTKIHASNSYYEINPGEFVGKGKLSDTDELPDGRRITKHSFWFPKKYIKEVLDGKWD